MNLPKWSITLLLLAFSVFALAGGNGVNSYTLGWSETHATDGDVYWGVSGPFDYDADGYSEVVAYTDDGGITLHMYENDGNDAWNEVWTYTIAEVSYSYEVADQATDLDRNGIAELLVAGEGGSTGDFSSLFIFELDTAAVTLGNIAFLQVAVVNPAEVAGLPNDDGVYATSVKTIVADDLDADGVTELLLYDGRTHAVQIMSLDTTSNFAFPSWSVEFIDQSFCCSVYGGAVIGDFDANGTNNFAMVQWNYNEISFFDVLGENDYELIQFVEGVSAYDGGSKRALAAADLNADGYTELYLASTAGNVLVYDIGADLADFDGATDVYEIYTGSDAYSFRGAQLGDTDIWHGASDGADFIITTSDSTILDLEYDNMGDVTSAGSWTAYEIDNPSSDTWQDVVLGDFDYDGLEEIFAVTKSTPTVQIYEHDGWNSAGSVDVRPVVAEEGVNPGWQTRGIAAGSDIDGDGRQEVIITDYAVHGVHIYEVAGDNTLEWMVTLQDDSSDGSSTPRHCIVADLDNNGRQEVAWIQHYTGGSGLNGVVAWEWDGVTGSDNYTFYSIPITIADGTELDRYYGDRQLNAGDPDDDGQTELLISNNGNSGETYDIHMIAHIDGTFESGFYSLVTEFESNKGAAEWGGSPGYGQANIADLDGDGAKEVCFFSWNNNTMLVLEAVGADDYEIQSAPMLDSASTDKVVYGKTYVSDINGDGVDEIYGGSYSAGWLWQVTGGDDVADISFENGNINIISDFGAVWDITGGDSDGDGVDELYSVDYTHGRIYQWAYNAGNWDMSVVTNWDMTLGGFALDFANDLDGDGNSELVQGFLEPPFTGGNEMGYTFSISEFTTTGIDKEWTVITPADYKLSQNYPNPFNPSTTINFTLPLAKDNVNVIVYNMLGQEVVRLANNATYGPGSHSITWNSLKADGTPAAAGVYIYELRVGNVSKTAKMTLVK